jgi:formylglycine-generating enzyme required for sulfatase activity
MAPAVLRRTALLVPLAAAAVVVWWLARPAADGPRELGADSTAPPRASPLPEEAMAPAGMVYVDVAGAKVGTAPEEVLKLARGRKEVLTILMYETPVHDPKLVPYFLDKYEVTNAQYHKFLEDTGRITVFQTGSAALGTLEEVARQYAHEGRETAAAKGDHRSWGQIYELNKAALNEKLPDLKGAKAQFRNAALPPGIALKVYLWRLPQTWFQTSGTLEGNAAPDHPVRDVSYTEAEAFAEWAGKHVMTEAEYEWAARGPEGRSYPWGREWIESDGAGGTRVFERRCNWGESSPKDAAYKPTTVAVTALPEGQSWCGAFHLLGNVAEWTSSWFEAYPGWNGSTDPRVNFYSAYQGTFARVIRGASCADGERVALRSAYRDFVGGGRLKPPTPDHSFEYVGFRCAYYLTVGRDRLQSTIAKVLRPKKIRPEQIAADRFAGAVATRFAPKNATVKNHVYVTGRAHTMLFVPVKHLFTDGKKRAPATTVAELLKLNPTTLDPAQEAVILGVIRTDVPLKVKVKDPKFVPPAEAAGAGRRERDRKDAVPHPIVPGTLEPDTYLLGLSRGQVGFYRSNLDLVAYVDQTPYVKQPKLKKGEAVPATSLTVDADVDLVTLSFFVAYGGKGSTDEEGVTFTFAMNAETGAMEKAGSWR